jgi:hypothetical protein
MVGISDSIPGVTGISNLQEDVSELLDTGRLIVVNGRLFSPEQVAERIANVTSRRYDLVQDGDFVTDVLFVAGFQEISAVVNSETESDFDISIQWFSSPATSDLLFEQEPSSLQGTDRAILQSVTVKADWARFRIRNADPTASTNPITLSFNIH